MKLEICHSFRGSATERITEALPHIYHMGRSRYKTIENGKTYYVTSTVVNWLPLFSAPQFADIVLSSLKFLHDHRRIVLHAYVLMETHLHFIGSSSDFSNEMRKFKSFTARSIIDHMQARGPRQLLEQLKLLKKPYKTSQRFQVWQEGYHPKLIADEKMLIQKIEYIHFNPVRRGYVDKPEHWRYSSSRSYIGMKGLIPIEKII